MSDEALVSLRARAEQANDRARKNGRKAGLILLETAEVEALLDRLEAAERERDRFKLMAQRGQDAETEKIERGTRLLAAQQALREADDLLRRLSGWDTLNLTPGSGDDGPYWQGEIAKVRAALAAIPLESTSEKSVGRVPAQENKP